jgi:hypothetical protein
MLLRAYSDLHGFLPHIEPCDALLIAGDICPIGGEYGDHMPKTQARWLKEVFNPWCEAMPVDRIVLIGGNHDSILDPIVGRGFHWELSEKVTYLLDTSVQIPNGPLIFGQPWIPKLWRWSFYKSNLKLADLASELPEGHDIWLFHSPPRLTEPGYLLDLTYDGVHAGNRYVTPVIEERGPHLVICGHIHEGFGETTIGETQVVNVAFIDKGYNVCWRHLDIVWDSASSQIVTTLLAGDDPGLGLWWSCK